MRNTCSKTISIALLLMLCIVTSLFGGCSNGAAPAVSSASEESQGSKPVSMYHASYVKVTFPELVQEADTIVYGEITNVQPSRQRPVTDTVMQVYTPIEITPIDLIKGENNGQPELYNRIGGEYEGVIYKISGDDLDLQVGQRIFIYISDIDSDFGPTSVFVEQDGKIKVWDDELGIVETTVQEYSAKVREELQNPTSLPTE